MVIKSNDHKTVGAEPEQTKKNLNNKAEQEREREKKIAQKI